MFITLLTRAGSTLLMEGGLACILAVILGCLFWKSKKAGITLGLTTCAGNVFLLLVLSLVFDPHQLPFHHLDPQLTKFSDNVAPYLIHIYLILEIAMWTTALSGAVGYFFNQEIGSVMFTGAFVAAATVCMVMTAAPFYIFDMADTTWALVIAVILIGTVGPWFFNTMIVRGKSTTLFTLLWFELVFSCWLGYQVAGRIGLLLITLPAQAIFWGALYYFSILSLPLPNHEKIPTLLNLFPFGEEVAAPAWRCLFPSGKDDPRILALRSVLTLAMGTNYPYYVIDDWKTRETLDKEKPDPHVNGDPYKQFYAGPGIILTRCDHLAVTSDGIKFRVCPPGLSFTRQFENLYTDVDLRPQLRGITINAETKDGITASIFTFIPNRVWADGRKVHLGTSYPYNEDAVINAVYRHAVIEHKFDRDENQLVTEETTHRPWHELVLTMGPPLLKDVVANYTCNELHMDIPDPDKPKYEPPQKLYEELSGGTGTGMGTAATLAPTTKLQQFMAHRLDADEVKDLAFDMGGAYTLFQYRTEEELAQTLVQYCADRSALDDLAQQIQKRWPSQYIAQLFPRPGTYTPPAKVEVLLATEEGSKIHLEDLQKTLASHFDVAVDQITVIGAAKRSLRVLIGVPEGAITPRVLSAIPPAGNAKCTLIALTAFASLSREMQNAWRYVCCSAPPTVSDDFLQPEIAWDDALEASRIRNPRAEISSTFIGKLKEAMKPLGIEVIGGGISDIKVPDDITAQRIKNWEVKREKDIEVAIAEAKARIALQEQERRAEVRLEMLTKLTQILQEAERDVNKRILAAKLFEAMGVHPPSDTETQENNTLPQLQIGGPLTPYLLDLLRNADT
ncbi:MAG TPA: hypothetical protein PLH19_02615 [Anaerolineae bacterium]|nr:hypothetical protein [Anaerolineae bacterium]HQH37413.1 hypothetical protein [Anaerolineae bacterium]